MALAIAGVGGTYAYQDAAAPGTNASAVCTSASHTFAVDDLVVVVMVIEDNNVVLDWHLIAIAGVGGPVLGTADIQQGVVQDVTNGYTGVVDVGIAKVITAGTGTITATRTAGTADHWTTASFTVVTGQDLTTPRPQAIASTGQAGGVSTTVTCTLGSAPASTSLLIGGIFAAAASSTATAPSGWTENAETSIGYGCAEQATKLGSGSTASSWVVSSNQFGQAASLIEIAAAASATNAPIEALYRNVPFMTGHRRAY